MLDKDVDDKASDRKSQLKDTRTGRMNMFDATIIHRCAENA